MMPKRIRMNERINDSIRVVWFLLFCSGFDFDCFLQFYILNAETMEVKLYAQKINSKHIE